MLSWEMFLLYLQRYSLSLQNFKILNLENLFKEFFLQYRLFKILEFLFTITLRQKPKRVTRMLSLCLVIQRGMRINPLGLGVIGNEKPQNLEKTTSSVLSVLLSIYDYGCRNNSTQLQLQLIHITHTMHAALFALICIQPRVQSFNAI